MTPSLRKRTAVSFLFFALTVLLTACHREKPVDNTPTITSFSPEKGNEGSSVEITGTHFSTTKESNTVKFGDLTATVAEATITKLTVTVPENAATGKITVTVDGKTATSSKDFTVDPLAPVVTAFTPDKGGEGTTLTITGTNFKAGTKVYVGTKEATDVVVVSKNQITGKVAAGSSTDKLKIVGPNGEAMSASNFYMLPTIASITSSAEEGQEVTISGTNFSEVAAENIISFGGGAVAANEIVSVSKTEIRVKAPVAGQNGKVTVAVVGQTATSADDFTYKSTITDFMPKHGERGSEVTLTGKRFSENPLVTMNDITMHINSKSVTEIKFTVTDNDAVVGDKITLKGNGAYQTISAFEVTNIFIQKSNGADFGSDSYQHSVAFTINGKIYLGWGNLPSNNNFKSFDISASTWSTVPASSLSSTRYNSSVIVINNKAYLGLGGVISGPSEYNSWWEFDPAKLTGDPWTAKKPIPSFGKGNATIFTLGSKTYLGLGSAGSEGDYRGYEYDPVTDNWTVVFNESNNFPKLVEASAFVIGSDIFFGGGSVSSGGYLSENKQWYKMTGFGTGVTGFTPISSISTLDIHGPSFTWNNKGYVLSSYGLYEYTPDSWKKVSDIPYGDLYTNAYVVISNEKIFAISSSGKVYQYIPNY